MKESSFEILLQDLKISFRFAWKNVISYVLAMIGVLIVAGILMVIVAAAIMVPVILAWGIEPMTQFFVSLGQNWSALQGAELFSWVMFLAIPLLGPFFVALGALFGMAREIVESDGTTAEGVFVWYRKKFLSLAGGGVVLFLVSVMPIALMSIWALTVTGGFMGGSMLGLPMAATAAFAVVWFVMTTGMLSMLFPGIIDGLSVLGAVKQSVRLSRHHFDRVYGTWLSYIAAFILLSALTVVLIPVGVIASLALVFLGLPAMTIGLTRVYLILTDNPNATEATEDEGPDVRLVGGV